MVAIASDTSEVLPEAFSSWKAYALHLKGQLNSSESRCKISDLRGDKLELKVADLIRRLYGPKSEKLNAAQRLLFGILEGQEALQQPPFVAQPDTSTRSSGAIRKRRGAGRRPLPENLPIRERIVDLPAEQKTGLIKIREEVSWQIEYRPSLFYRLKIVRPVYASPTRAHAPIVRAMPPQILPQAGVGPSFITHVVISKFADHLPLFRQERIDARGGIWIDRQKRNRCVEAAAELLIKVRDLGKEQVLASRYVQVDETFTKLLDPDRRGRSRDAYLWGYHAPEARTIVLEFSKSRSGSILHDFFPPDWMGILQSDGAQMYPGALKHRPNIRHFECVMHLRRKVRAAVVCNDPDALPLLKEITRLYRLETVADERGLTPVQRGYFRHAKAKPILKELHRRFLDLDRGKPLDGHLRTAVTYALKRWPRIVRYAKVGFGHVLIDQNAIERCFRPMKIGQRNWTFIGHPSAGWRSAVIYSVIGTCRLNGINPAAYIRWALPRLASRRAKNREHFDARGLLPQDFARLHRNTELAHAP
jgi:transposase